MTHARVHVSLAAFDVVVEVVAEQLDVRDRVIRHIRLRKVARKEHKSDISNVFGIPQPWHVSDLERRIAISVEYLGSVLDAGLTSSIYEFLMATS